MYKRYRETFSFADTEKQAKELCCRKNALATPYMRKNKPASYTPWTSNDGKEKAYIVWYYA